MLHQLQPPAPEPTSASARRLDRHDWQEQIAPGYKHLPEGSNIVPPMRFNDLPEEDIANFGRTILGAMLDTDAENPLAQRAKESVAAIDNTQAVILTEGENPFLREEQVPLRNNFDKILADPAVKEYLGSRTMEQDQQLLRLYWSKFAADFRGRLYSETGKHTPLSVLSRVEPTLKATKVQLIDKSAFEVATNMATGIYDEYEDKIKTSADAMAKGGVIFMHMLTHEVMHKLSGGSFRKSHEQDQEAVRTRTGFSTEKKDGTYVFVGLNEAMTEHVTCALFSGDFDTIDPTGMSPERQGYYAPRKVLAEAVGRSGGLITAPLLVAAYFEDTGTKGEVGERMKMVRAFKAAYSSHALRDLEATMQRARSYDNTAQDIDEKIKACFISPVISENGAIVTPGRIDATLIPEPKNPFEDIQPVVFN